jgi:two-component system OmpR family response regulator
MRALLVEDDVLVASGIKLGLVQAGYAVDWAGTAERALDLLAQGVFDIAVVDLGLPAMDGFALTQSLRRDGHTFPVLILSARDALNDRVQGLDDGADDYLVKPCALPELLARMRALLRRSQAATSATLRLGPLELDTAHHTAYIHLPAAPGAGVPQRMQRQLLDLGPREWAVLEYLLLQAPKPSQKERLLQALTGHDQEITPNAVEVYISRLRTKLEPFGLAIKSIRGFGYRLDLAGGA